MKRALKLIALLLLCLVIAACLTDRAAFQARDNYGGFVVWDCSFKEPTIFINADLLVDSVKLGEVLVHENDHKTLMLKFPSCRAYHVWRSDPANRLYFETHAYCAAIAYHMERGMTRANAVYRAADQLTNPIYPFDLTIDEATAVINKTCVP